MAEESGSWLIIDCATNPDDTDREATGARPCGRGVRTVRVFGEIDLGTGTAFEAGLERALAAAPRRIVVDCSAMAFCDARGLGALMSVVARAAERDVDVAVVGLSPLLGRLCAQLWPGPQPIPCSDVTDAISAGGVPGRAAVSVPT